MNKKNKDQICTKANAKFYSHLVNVLWVLLRLLLPVILWNKRLKKNKKNIAQQ